MLLNGSKKNHTINEYYKVIEYPEDEKNGSQKKEMIHIVTGNGIKKIQTVCIIANRMSTYEKNTMNTFINAI